MDTKHACFPPHGDPEAFLAFHRDALGLEARNDVDERGMPADESDTSIVLEPPAAEPRIAEVRPAPAQPMETR